MKKELTEQVKSKIEQKEQETQARILQLKEDAASKLEPTGKELLELHHNLTQQYGKNYRGLYGTLQAFAENHSVSELRANLQAIPLAEQTDATRTLLTLIQNHGMLNLTATQLALAAKRILAMDESIKDLSNGTFETDRRIANLEALLAAQRKSYLDAFKNLDDSLREKQRSDSGHKEQDLETLKHLRERSPIKNCYSLR